jgi:ABC-type thiamin/hydroxymethylpyrimidine transport system permease subunit
MLEYMDVMDIVVSDVLKIVYAQIFALLMNLLNVLF